MTIVIIFNAMKAACFLLIITKRGYSPLITLGDGIASFLASPDDYTRDFGPLSAADVRASDELYSTLAFRLFGIESLSTSDRGYEDGTARLREMQNSLPAMQETWRNQKQTWFSGASRSRWGLTLAMWERSSISATGIVLIEFRCLALWIAAWIALSSAYLNKLSSQDSLQTLWDNGFGNPSPRSTITFTSGLSVATNVLIANTPQLAMSMMYMSFNGLLTCMTLSREFTIFSRKRCGLRVTNPDGGYQRSTYWLSLPYRYSIPLLGLSAAFHWALSQTLFLVEARVYNPAGVLDPDPNNALSVVGWSALSLIIVIVMGGILMLAPLAMGYFFRYNANIPIVESCSLAISAACHTLGRQDEAKALLLYGVSRRDDGVEHVGLCSSRVAGLVEGERYTNRTCIRDWGPDIVKPFPVRVNWGTDYV